MISLITLSGNLFAQDVDSKKSDDDKKSAFIETNKNKLGWSLGHKWYFSFNAITPTPALYFDLRKDAKPDANGNPVEPDFYTDGAGKFDLRLISFDFLKGENIIRWGANLGFGVSPTKANTGEAGYLVTNLGLVLSFDQNFRIEAGYIIGISAKESYSKKTDDAIYFGVSFPIVGSENVKKWLKE
jgi:hypothetical protein